MICFLHEIFFPTPKILQTCFPQIVFYSYLLVWHYISSVSLISNNESFVTIFTSIVTPLLSILELGSLLVVHIFSLFAIVDSKSSWITISINSSIGHEMYPRLILALRVNERNLICHTELMFVVSLNLTDTARL